MIWYSFESFYIKWIELIGYILFTCIINIIAPSKNIVYL